MLSMMLWAMAGTKQATKNRNRGTVEMTLTVPKALAQMFDEVGKAEGVSGEEIAATYLNWLGSVNGAKAVSKTLDREDGNAAQQAAALVKHRRPTNS